ncbi:MAG: polysaccharide biosynthesis/export family protein, partial [Magnetococcales bacterium]|nr:polysaccharide biosynthesis/export family protein [Magnetococcales bacterium]
MNSSASAAPFPALTPPGQRRLPPLGQRLFLALSLACTALPGCQSVPEPAIQDGEEIILEKHSFSHEDTKLLFDSYQIQPGDKLDLLFNIKTRNKEGRFYLSLGDTVEVRFPFMPDWNTVQKIRPDGTISLPEVGSVNVSDITVEELSDILKERYSRILVDPQLVVLVPEFLSQLRELKTDLHTASRGLSRLVTVRPDGYVTFPMAGNVLVAGKSIEEVTIYLNAEYKKVSPSLYADVFLEESRGSTIHLLGEVAKPGAYPISSPISLAEAIALGGGYSHEAMLDSVVVIRREKKKVYATRVNLAAALSLTSGEMFFVSPNDLILVPRSRISTVAQLMDDVGRIGLFKGWSLGGS